MATPQINTKVELVVEAIEDLAIAAATASRLTGREAHQCVLDARENAASALREFLQPVLRVVPTQ